MAFLNKVWYFFHRLKRNQYAYIVDYIHSDYRKEDRFYDCHYVEYDRKTGEITCSKPYTYSFEPYRSKFYKLKKDRPVFQKHLEDFEKATGISISKYTMDYGDEDYLEYLKKNFPDAVLAKKF